ncbi:TylF/MycF/NovP-related O-methyltransferase [Candidatus Solirubrobacter pratensis]|uniref:TylF/MycF/NovP-related O-methyltransferase n=1 Tax=Candidatus Solirubrobacter pratensis TaxID=1298857 RepID=UPI000562F492|nr:TylF/MycF/NovP-related O-methyltransferase [Candidatus Solirubrobacter pratensis]
MPVKYSTYYGKLLRDGGFSIAKGAALPLVRREAVRSGAYAMAYPVSAYAPWEADEPFQQVYQAVRRHTLVDVWRCHELWELVGELREIPGAILEVGVWRGGTGAVMARRAELLGIDEPVFLADTWEGVVKTGALDIYYRDGKHSDTSRETVESLVQGLRLRNVELLQGIFPDDTAHSVGDLPLRLCHIDVDVYQSAKDVFEWAWPRLSTGGLVVFDDYGCAATPGITEFVNEQRSLTDRLVVHNLNGHGIIVKR